MTNPLTRPLVVAAVAALLALVIWWTRVDTRKRPATAAPSPTPAAVGAATPKRTPTLAQRAARDTNVDAMHRQLDGFDAWLNATFPTASATLLAVDCAAAPCMIGVRFMTQYLGPDEIRALHRGVREEIERRAGTMMAVIHSDQDREGRDYLWMYGLPGDVDTEEREMLRSSAESRYSARMAPLRPTRTSPLPDRGRQPAAGR